MKYCRICLKKDLGGNRSFFSVPRDIERREKWSQICQIKLSASSCVCSDHFKPSCIITAGQKRLLMPHAVPTIPPEKNNVAAEEDLLSENENEVSTPNLLCSNSNVTPPQLEEPIMHIPIMKSSYCSRSTQTNTRLCGSLEVSDFEDDLRINCFYCSKEFVLEEWKKFINHLKDNHLDREEAFKRSEYVSEDHDYTPLSLRPCSPAESVLESDVKSEVSSLEDPLEPNREPFKSFVLNSAFYYTPYNNSSLVGIPVTPEETAIGSCPKRTNVEEMELEKKEDYESISIEIVQQNPTEVYSNIEVEEPAEKVSIEILQQKPTEISLEYTPRDVLDLLLDNMKNYPVLWQFDNKPFNKDFCEAVQDLCKIINEKWSLNIDSLKMQRSINRILRFYCSNTIVENVDKFAYYYDKCAAFLPSSVNKIAYARCSHCYICYSNDFELKSHLLIEQSSLQWPFNCKQCKECFRERDDYQLHRRLPHYDEIFRCEPCNMNFFHRNTYSKHISIHIHKDSKYKCDICEKTFQTHGAYRYHKILHDEKKHKCHLCPKSYYDNSQLKQHLKRHQKEYDFICEVCGKGFVTQTNLSVHMNTHTGEKISCKICNLKLRKSSLSRHLRIVHDTNKGNDQPKNLYYRRLIRSKPTKPARRIKWEERNYHCKICKISFANYKLIVEHNKELHFDTPKWPCKICSTEFNLKLNLKRHYRKKHNLHVIQVFKLVDENEDLNSVLATKTEHLEEYAKTKYGITFAQSENDNELHSDISNWPCKLCGNEFSNKSKLRRHYRRKHKLHLYQIFKLVEENEALDVVLAIETDHINEFVETPICSKNEIENLTKSNIGTAVKKSRYNKELHSVTPKWTCKMCSGEFSQKLNLKEHYRRKHNLQVFQVFKLVEENEDLDEVLDIETDHSDKLFEAKKCSKSKPNNLTKSNIKTSDLLEAEFYLEKENVNSSATQDDNFETQEIKIDMNDFFTDL